MTFDQIAALVVLAAVVGVLIHGRVRADVVALTGAAALLVHRLSREDFPRSGARVAADGRIEVPTRVAGSDQPAPPAAPR